MYKITLEKEQERKEEITWNRVNISLLSCVLLTLRKDELPDSTSIGLNDTQLVNIYKR